MKASDDLQALLYMIDEPDETLFEQISKYIVMRGNDVLPSLTNLLSNCNNEQVKERIIDIIAKITQQDAIIRLNQWKEKRSFDLLEPNVILCRYRYSRLDWNILTFQIMALAEQISQELNTSLTPLEQIKVINHVFYDINMFEGNILDIRKPDQYYLNNVFENRNGNPYSLGILYIIIANRLHLPIYGVNIPHHFILAYTNDKTSQPKLEDVLFYINPFNRGALFTKKEILKYLEELNIKPRKKYFEPSNNCSIFSNLLKTLMEAHSDMGNDLQVDQLRPLLETID
jgi:Uncharacterized conserved protein